MNVQSGFVGKALMVAGVVGLTASAAQAQTAMASDPGFYVTGSAGLSMPRDSNIDGTGVNTSAALDNGWAAFLGAGYGFANGLRGELEFGHQNVGVDSVGGAANSAGDYKVWSAMANLLYDWRTSLPVVPYIGAGIGVARLDLDGVRPVAGSTVDQAENAFAWQAMAGVGYAITDQLTASLGYKYFAIPDAGNYTTAAGTAVDSDYASHNVLVGLRYALNPPAKPMPVAQPAPAPAPQPAPPPPAPQVARNYIVFFDWDSVVLTDEAKGILRTAADNAKRVAPVRINATGHADRSGPDGYNMALSLRRANAVKAELVRLGVPESEIAVAGRGEAEPLVATADGIREPQNRRVQIILQ